MKETKLNRKVQLLALFILTAIVFLAIDALWLGVLAKDMYAAKLGPIIPLGFDLAAGSVFYIVYISGILYFSIYPALKSGGSRQAIRQGAILGALCYATYDLTNWATIEGWPVEVVIYDILWGAFITGFTAMIVVLLAGRLSIVK